MNIILKQLHMENFKVFQNVTFNFTQLTKIFAQNYKGKSSIVDGFSWVLFGKSSTENSEGKQFHPRRYDKNGIDIDHVDIVVELILEVDGKEIVIRKTQKQNWVRHKGAEIESYEGDKNYYTWNTVSTNETEHKKRVTEIIDEEVFKMITNPHAFVSKKQDEQRNFLVEKVAQITNADVFALNGEFAELEALTENNTIEEIKAINKKALQGYKELQTSIPVRIDEKSKEIVDMDFAERELALAALKEQLADVEKQIADTSKGYETVNQLKSEIAEIKGKIEEIERVEKKKLQDGSYNVRMQIQDLGEEIWKVDKSISRTKDEVTIKTKSIQRNTEFLAESKRQYVTANTELKTVQAEQFDENSLNCPTCKQSLPIENQTSIRSKYEVEKQSRINAKQKKLDGVVEQGNLFNEEITKDKAVIEELEKKLSEYESEKTNLQTQLDSKKAEFEKLPTEIDLSNNQVYEALENDLINANGNLETAVNMTKDIEAQKQSLIDSKFSIQNQIDTVKTELAKKQTIDNAKDRVDELREELKQATQKLANCEKLDDLIERFEKSKMQLLSERINKSFKLVQWKLWNKQKNGGIEPVCVCMVHGSPYGENTTSSTEQLMAGMDIISTLQEIYNVKAPIFVDNKERFNDWNIPKMDCQMILLSVSEDSDIRVEG